MISTSPRFIKKPHAAIICGATDCGKTEFTLNLLETEYKQFFNACVKGHLEPTHLKSSPLFTFSIKS